MGRSATYWATNLYPDMKEPPRPAAPYRDLPMVEAGRFRTLREGVVKLPGVSEHVRFLGPTWRWTWEYGMGQRRLCWLHAMRGGVSTTFTLTQEEEREALRLPKLALPIQTALRYGQRTGPVRWCWLEVGDRKAVDALLTFLRRKAAWMAAMQPVIPRRQAAS